MPRHHRLDVGHLDWAWVWSEVRTYDRTHAGELFTPVEAYEHLVAHPDDEWAGTLILAEGQAAVTCWTRTPSPMAGADSDRDSQ
jgi:hypothetical protein